MSGEHDSFIEDSTEEQGETQLADQEITSKSHEENKIPTEVKITFELLGVTTDNQLLDELKEAKINVRDSQEEVKIQKVPTIMVRNYDYFREYFMPRELSIGPIYADHPCLFKKQLKLKLAAYFIELNDKIADELLELFKAEFADIMTHFDKDIIMSCTDDELIRLVFLGGCAMLGFIDSSINGRLNEFGISNGQADLIRQDLFLVENQIPFLVLERLMGFETESGSVDLVHGFCRFIALMGNNLGEVTKCLVLDSVHKHPLHILDLLREVLLLDNPHQNECIPTYLIGRLFSLLCYSACGAVAFISRILKRFNKPESLPKYRSKITQNSFPNVKELKKAGIEFKPSDSLKSISFRSSFFTTAQLKLPRLVVDDLTVKMLFNLAAYEMCLSKSHPNQKPWSMATYIKLLDELVDDENDVMDLKAADILQTGHISDAKVANLINAMGSELLPPVIDTYAHVKEKIENHCRRRCRRRCALWTAQVYSTHFKSPWTILALFAAITVLALTAVQTWYAVNPKK